MAMCRGEPQQTHTNTHTYGRVRVWAHSRVSAKQIWNNSNKNRSKGIGCSQEMVRDLLTEHCTFVRKNLLEFLLQPQNVHLRASKQFNKTLSLPSNYCTLEKLMPEKISTQLEHFVGMDTTKPQIEIHWKYARKRLPSLGKYVMSERCRSIWFGSVTSGVWA